MIQRFSLLIISDSVQSFKIFHCVAQSERTSKNTHDILLKGYATHEYFHEIYFNALGKTLTDLRRRARRKPSHRTLFFRFRIPFHRKEPASGVDAPPREILVLSLQND